MLFPDVGGYRNPQCIAEPSKDEEQSPQDKVLRCGDGKGDLSLTTEEGKNNKGEGRDTPTHPKEELPENLLGIERVLNLIHASIIAEFFFFNKGLYRRVGALDKSVTPRVLPGTPGLQAPV